MVNIGVVGGGPSALFMLKRIVESKRSDISVVIFERKDKLGAGMPYSAEGACPEHITNVSGNEIPDLVTTVEDWVGMKNLAANRFEVSVKNFNDYKVLPRLLFGEFLTQQFDFLLVMAKRQGLNVIIHLLTEITDIRDLPLINQVELHVADGRRFTFDKIVICSGHYWPKSYEGRVKGYYDSPYPPQKLNYLINHKIAIRGASLTAIDALRTLALANGSFEVNESGRKIYHLREDCSGLKIIMHSRNGMLPAVRFHLEDSHLAKDSVLGGDEIDAIRNLNNGFLPLDYIYQRNFLEGVKDHRPEFYELIKDLSLEDFVELMMIRREDTPAFELLKSEYAQAEQSIALKRSVYWKEMLAVLSFAMNYPAKYFSAEDMIRLQQTLMPLISIVIAFAPQDSVEEMIALYDAGILTLINVGVHGHIEPREEGGVNYHYTDENGSKLITAYDTFIDCIGQPHLNLDQVPYPSLIQDKTISPAKIRFKDQRNAIQHLENSNRPIFCGKDGDYHLSVPGITIDDHFRVVDESGTYNNRIHIMAVPYIGGYNPDYSGLDFGEAASQMVIEKLI